MKNNDESSHSRGQYWEIILGKPQSDISNILKDIDTPDTNYQLLSECSTQEASALTGLNIEQAEQAISREFSEPLIWKSSDKYLDIFINELKGHNLNTLQGGRFLHVIGNCDKGIATKKLKDILFSPEKNIKSIILGDSENDAAMLQLGDISIIVKSPSNYQLQKLITPTIHTSHEAPFGWAEAIDASLNKIKELK